MTGAEILALISAFATGSIGTGLASSAIYDGIKNAYALLPISNPRKRAMSKTWSGSFTQNKKTYNIELSLKVRRKRIVGTGKYVDGGVIVELNLEGGFYRDDHLHLSYKNKDGSVFQHGLIVLHVPNNPRSLTGKFVGIGRDSNQIVGGDIRFDG
jgi:glycyl-tRNA synthetase (class II)